MSDQLLNAIEAAIRNMESRSPKPKGRREVLTLFVPRLRKLRADGWSQTEIIADMKAAGVQMSPALLRDVLQIDLAKPKKVNPLRKARRRASASPSTASAPAIAAMPHIREQIPIIPPSSRVMPYRFGQQRAVVAPIDTGHPTNDAGPE